MSLRSDMKVIKIAVTTFYEHSEGFKVFDTLTFDLTSKLTSLIDLKPPHVKFFLL